MVRDNVSLHGRAAIHAAHKDILSCAVLTSKHLLLLVLVKLAEAALAPGSQASTTAGLRPHAVARAHVLAVRAKALQVKVARCRIHSSRLLGHRHLLDLHHHLHSYSSSYSSLDRSHLHQGWVLLHHWHPTSSDGLLHIDGLAYGNFAVATATRLHARLRVSTLHIIFIHY